MKSPNPNRHERLTEALREVAAEFLVREANRNTLVTVTRVMLSEDNKRATIYITVLPDSGERAALDFANRNRTELKDFFHTRVKGASPPDMHFEIDVGDKARRHLDELSN
ncbi:MAG TPA: ribosome-binding factor A [Candidatus Paceibacterota bacterium]|nr:ribosome-binding factor A [Candidatus Paceibacterota bacterium]